MRLFYRKKSVLPFSKLIIGKSQFFSARSYVYLHCYTQERDRGGTMCPLPGQIGLIRFLWLIHIWMTDMRSFDLATWTDIFLFVHNFRSQMLFWFLCDGMMGSFILLWMQDEEETSTDISDFSEFRIHRANLSSIFLSFSIQTTKKSWWMIIQNVLHEKVCSIDLPLVVLWLRLV